MLEVITGCMFSGKSEELTRRLRRAKIARQSVMAFKPAIDDRYNAESIASHSSIIFSAKSFNGFEDLKSKIEAELLSSNHCTSVIGIDEVQFLPNELVVFVEGLANQDIKIIVSGLDTDYLGNPFGPMPGLLAIADSVTKLSAICVATDLAGNICGKPATKTYRFSDSSNGAIIQVGAAESYQARCRVCWRKQS